MGDENSRNGSAASRREQVVWDAAIGEFVRLTLDASGKVLVRVDLDPNEKRAVLRCLFSTRTTHDQRDGFCRELHRLGLIVVLENAKGHATDASVSSLTGIFSAARGRREIEGFAEWLNVSNVQLLTLAWAVNFAVARPGQPLPRLDCVDPDLAHLPPIGADCPPAEFDAEGVLEEIEREETIGFALRC